MLVFLLVACGYETGLKSVRSDPGAPVDSSSVERDTALDTGWVPVDTGGVPDPDSAQPDETAPPDTGSPDTDPPDTGSPDTDPPDTGSPDTDPPDSSVDPCDDAPDIDCPVDTLDPSPCTRGVAAWLPTGRTYVDVQSALDAAVAGDTVAVCPGTWTGTLSVSTPDLILRGYGASTTALDAAGGRTTLEVMARRLAVVDLTVTGGANLTGAGGGLRADRADLRLCSVSVTGNRAYSGGGVFVGEGALEVSGGLVEGNSAETQGGGIDAGRALLTVVGTRFEGNASGYAGGALFGAVEGGMGVHDSTFVDNRTGYEGGAVAVNGNTFGDGACFVDTTFSANVADYAGGAVSSNGWGAMVFGYEGCTFDSNYAAFGGGAVAYQQWGSDTSVTVDTTFTGNSAGDHGGAVDLSGGWGVLDASFYATTFDGNTALLAGAIQAGGVGTERVLLVDSAVVSSTARYGGGIFIDASSTVEARNVDFGSGATDNRPEDIYGTPPRGAGETFTCTGGVCR